MRAASRSSAAARSLSQPPQISYAGDTAIDAGTLLLGSDNQIPDGAGKGNVNIAANAVLDLNGKSETVNRLIGLGSIINTSGATTLGVLADGSSDTWDRDWLPASVTLDKQGTGTLSLAACSVITTNATVSAGTLRLTTSQGYPFYRFKIEGVRDPANAVAMQFSELVLYNGDINVTANRTNFLYDATGGYGIDSAVNASPDGERPEKAVDGFKYPDGSGDGNKWLDYRIKTSRSAADHERVWIRLDFPTNQKITRYNWATGNDAPDRDPAAWRLQGSNNGTDWVNIDVKTGFNATVTRNAWVSSEGFPVSPQNNAPNAISDQAVVTLKEGANLLLDGVSETLGGLTGLGTVTISNANLTLSSPSGTTRLFRGGVSGNGTLIKTGTGQQYLAGTNASTGDLVVKEGTLSVLGNTTYRWFRFTIKKNRNDSLDTQISELALYSADGTRRNLHLTEGGSTTTLLANQFATPESYSIGSPDEVAANLFDGSTDTKWCLNKNTPDPNTPSTYRVIVMRLAEDSPEITALQPLHRETMRTFAIPSPGRSKPVSTARCGTRSTHVRSLCRPAPDTPGTTMAPSTR